VGIFDKLKDMVIGEYEDDEEMEIDGDGVEVDFARESERRKVERDRSERGDSDFSFSSGRALKRNAPQTMSIRTNVQMQVFVVKPERYEDAQEICDHIKAKRPVVVNLEKLEYPIAQRIMDFLSGTSYSLDGTIQRVAKNIFMIAPENVDISGDFKQELKTKGLLVPWNQEK